MCIRDRCCYLLLLFAFIAAKKTKLNDAFIMVLILGVLWVGGSFCMRMQFWPSEKLWYDEMCIRDRYYLLICLVGVVCAIIVPRIPPLSLKKDTYVVEGKAMPETIPSQYKNTREYGLDLEMCIRDSCWRHLQWKKILFWRWLSIKSRQRRFGKERLKLWNGWGLGTLKTNSRIR